MTRRLLHHLIRKELHLQRSNILFVAGVVLFWLLLLLGCAQKEARVINYTMGEILLGIHTIAILPSLVLLLPLMFGATSIAGERQLDVLEWQLALPVSRGRQLFVKTLVVTVLCAVTGGILAIALDYLLPLEHTLLHQYRNIWPGVYSIMLGCIGMLASAHMRDPYRALVAAAGIVLMLLTVMHLFDPNGIVWPHVHGAYDYTIRHPFAMLPRALLAALLCAILAFPAFRPRDMKLRWLPANLILLAILIAATTLWTIRAARAIPGTPTLVLGKPGLTIRNYSTQYALQHPDLGDLHNTKSYDQAANRLWRRSAGSHLWTEGMITEYAGRLTLLAGAPGDWDHLEYLPSNDVQFIQPAYRSPSGKFVIGIDSTGKEFSNSAEQSVEFDIASGKYRNFPASIGQLYDWFGDHEYVMSPNGSTLEIVGKSLVPRSLSLEQYQNYISADGSHIARQRNHRPVSQPGPDDGILHIEYNQGPLGTEHESFVFRNAKQQLGLDDPSSRTIRVYWIGRSGLTVTGYVLNMNAQRSKWRQELFYVSRETNLAQLLSDGVGRTFADATGRWYLNRLDESRASISATPAAENPSTSYTLDADQRTSFTRGILKYCGQSEPSGPYPLRRSSLGLGNTELSISPDGKFLAYAVQTITGVRIGSEPMVEVPEWLEVHVLNLQSGDDRVLGGFKPGNLPLQMWALKALNRDYDWDMLDQHYRSVTGDSLTNQEFTSVLPPVAWSPDGKLAMLHEKYLYLFDPTAAPTGKDATAEFTRFEVNPCLASQLAFWDDETIVLWGRYSVWKLNIQPMPKPAGANQVAAIR